MGINIEVVHLPADRIERLMARQVGYRRGMHDHPDGTEQAPTLAM